MLNSKKLYKVFGDGTLGISDFLDDMPQNDTKLHEYILYDGSHYNVYSLLCNSFLWIYNKICSGDDASCIRGIKCPGKFQ